MFASDKRLRDRLLRDGQQAQGVVVASRPTTTTKSNRAGRFYLWKLTLRVRPAGAAEFDIDLKHYFRQWAPPNPGSTMTVLFDPNDHSKVSIDLDSLVSVPPATEVVETAALDASRARIADEAARAADGSIGLGSLLKGWRPGEQRALQDAQARLGQGVVVAGQEQVTLSARSAATNGIGNSGVDDVTPSVGPGSVVSGDQSELLAELTALHQQGRLDDAEFERAKRALYGMA